MSVAGINAADFYREAASEGRVWTIRNREDFPRRKEMGAGRCRSGHLANESSG